MLAQMQVKVPGEKNSIGECINSWLPVVDFKGYLDYQSGQTKYSIHSAKIEESTHVFICDFRSFTCLSEAWGWNPFNFLDSIINSELEQDIAITSENSRMLINGKLYDVLLIDDPMELHEHLEIYLKYVGGQNGTCTV